MRMVRVDSRQGLGHKNPCRSQLTRIESFFPFACFVAEVTFLNSRFEMARCTIAAAVFFVVAFLCLVSPYYVSQVSAIDHNNTFEDSADTGHPLRERLTQLLHNKQVFLLHVAKTGGSTSKIFAGKCTNRTRTNNFLNRGTLDFERLLNNTPERVVASHISSSRKWFKLLRCLTDEAVVIVPVRPFDSWYSSAVLQVASRNCVARPKCRVQEPACVITSEVLHRFIEKREYELNFHLGWFFSAVEQLQSGGLLRTKIFLVDFRHLDVVYNVISHRFCPTVTAINQNDHVVKARVFLDSADVNGSCAELSVNVSRSKVDLLSLNSRPYHGWQTDSIPSQVFDDGYCEYACSRHSRCMVACGNK